MPTDCISKDRSIAELLIVQRGGAASLTKSLRDRHTQAILSIDRMIVDAAGGEIDQVLAKDQVHCIICALGVGIDFGDMGSGTFRIDLLRYGKIILAFDDGSQDRKIREAVLAFLGRFLRPLLGEGYFYTLEPSPFAKMTEAEFERTITNNETRSLFRVSAAFERTLDR